MMKKSTAKKLNKSKAGYKDMSISKYIKKLLK